MTEAARKTLEEVNRKQFERLQKKADNNFHDFFSES